MGIENGGYLLCTVFKLQGEAMITIITMHGIIIAMGEAATKAISRATGLTCDVVDLLLQRNVPHQCAASTCFQTAICVA